MAKQVKAEILAVGTELLLGQIANTNAQWLSVRLADMGVNVFFHGVVGDNEERMRHQMEQANGRSDIVIVTGGLGPTDDDVTREVASEVLGLSIEEEHEALRDIEAYFEANNRQMTPNNRRQARMLKGSTILSNHVGMAPGFAVTNEGTTWIFLPGVPREMKAIMDDGGFELIRSHFSLEDTIQSRMLRFISIGESHLAHDLQDLLDQQTNPTIAPLAAKGEVALRITAKAQTKEAANKLIDHTEASVLDRVGMYCYGKDDDTLESTVFHMLKEQKETISAAESLTGGRFIDQVVSQQGASSVCNGGVVCYATAVKEQVLEVPKLIINEYGTVSETCAVNLAVNIANKLNSSIGISFTGVAGPDPVEGQPVGTVYIGIYKDGEQPFAKKFHFHGDREEIRQRSVKKGFELLYHYLK
ncbi:competence/damage-inducible protein A [Pontibacillus salicampi]|uniref:Putative competence-damage inducible protein n=1 Tax=Pontibacillus salicampi TaxID=1449801 RepID=A0ABV6LPG8_9BACI